MYKKQSLGSSLEHYYSIYGLVLNVALWSVVLFYIDKVIRRIIQTKRVNAVYKGVIVLLVVFSSFHVLFDFLLVGRGFEEKLNYWYWDIDKEAEDWGGKYERQLKIF